MKMTRRTLWSLFLLALVGPVGSVLCSENLVGNPSAERVDAAGKPVGWGHYENTPDPWGVTKKAFYTDARPAFLRIVDFGDDDYACTGLSVGKTDGYSGPDAQPVEPNTTYHFSFFIAGKGFRRKISVAPWGFKADGSGRDRNIGGIGVLPMPDWKRYTGSFRTKAETGRIALVFFVYGLRERDVEEEAAFYVDDVYIGVEEPPPAVAAAGRRRITVEKKVEVKGEGYSKLKPGTVRIWDANKKYKMKHYDFRAWKRRANWSAVPYGTTDHRFRGDCILEGRNFWISLHSSRHDSVFLYAKMDEEGTPSRHNEIYRAWDTPNGYCNYGGGSQLARILKNEPGEIIVESEAITYTRKGYETTVTTSYRILGGRCWVEIRPVAQASQQGMHGESRIIIAPEAGPGGNDWADDALRHPDGYTTRLPVNSKMLLDLILDADTIWVMTWPDPAKAHPNASVAYGGWPSGWQRIGEGDCRAVWTAPFAHFGEEKEPVYIGVLFKGYWIYQRIDRRVKAGEKVSGNWRWSHSRPIHGTPWKAGSSWRPLYPGKWRLTACIARKYYTQETIVTRADTEKSSFIFTCPVEGNLEYLIMYLYDRTKETPGDVCTAMDIYKEVMKQ